MPDDVPDRVARLERAREGGKPPVLRVRERCFTRALELDADGKIIAMRAPPPARLARVPRAPAARHELVELSAAADQEMSGYFRARDCRVERVRGGIKPVGEMLDDAGPAELPRRQADVVDDEEIYRAARGALVAIGRRDEPYPFGHSLLIDMQSFRHRDNGLVPAGWTYGPSSAFGVKLFINTELLHPVAQRPEGDAEQLRRGSAIEPRFLERLNDSLLFDTLEILRQWGGSS